MAYIPEALRRQVAARAQHRCEYCQTAQRISGAQMHVEHISPLAQGGDSVSTNLGYACAWCNSFKGTATHGIDPLTGETAALFNPRTQVWSEHFRWSEDGVTVVGLTPTGRATIGSLQMNNEFITPARQQWVIAGWHPPSD